MRWSLQVFLPVTCDLSSLPPHVPPPQPPSRSPSATMRRRGSHPSTRLGSSSRPSVSQRGSVLGAFVPQGLALLPFPGAWAVLSAASLALGASSNNAGLRSNAARAQALLSRHGECCGGEACPGPPATQQAVRVPVAGYVDLGEKQPRLLLPRLCPAA